MAVTVAVVTQTPVSLGAAEVALVALISFGIFYVLGPKLVADVRGWLGGPAGR